MTKFIGKRAEEIACDYLQLQNLKVITTNYHSRYGEIDVIAIDQDQTLCFIEVKARKIKHQSVYASAVEVVSVSKQEKIILTAQDYLNKHEMYQDNFCRFDVIAIEYSNIGQLQHPLQMLLKDGLFQLQWIQHAYTL